MSSNLDLRFAMLEDLIEIETFVNSVYNLENMGFDFRKDEPLLLPDTLCKEELSFGTRWILFETPAPHEEMCACARIHMINTAFPSVDIFCVAVQIDESIRLMIRNQFLNRLERALRGMGAIGVDFVEVPHWRNDVLDWLALSGYVESGGRLEKSLQSNSLLKDTMRIDLRKIFIEEQDLATKGKISTILQSSAKSCTDEISTMALKQIEDLRCDEIISSKIGDPIKALMKDLFQALHREVGCEIVSPL